MNGLPLEEQKTQGSEGLMKAMSASFENKRFTLREAAVRWGLAVGIPQLVGTPEQVADQLESIWRETGCHGFNLTPTITPSIFSPGGNTGSQGLNTGNMTVSLSILGQGVNGNANNLLARTVTGQPLPLDFNTKTFDVEANGTTIEYTRRGRLMLMPFDGEWKIFGFKMTPGGGS